MPKPPMTNGNQTISRSGVLGPALLVRTGTALEDFELYGSLQTRALNTRFAKGLTDTYVSSSTRIKAAPGAASSVIGPLPNTNH